MTRSAFTPNLLLAAGAFMLMFAQAAFADETADREQERMSLAGGAWTAGKNVPCADGVVTAVHSRLEEPPARERQTFGSGVVVEFRLPAAPRFFNGRPLRDARVVHYDGEPTNSLMQSEKIGDRLQICLIAFPTTTHDPQTGKIVCDPNVDPRGFVYRVYDYRRHRAYMGPDSQHSCGGA